MRLLLFPVSSKRTLLYCEQLNVHSATPVGKQPKRTIAERISTRASQTWIKWESPKASGWQKWVTKKGNAAFATIPYEEWSLKGVPSLSGTKRRRIENEDKGITERNGNEENDGVEVVFPSNTIEESEILGVLKRLATERQALHRKWMWGSIIGMPLSAPFALIPIIPNLPFFYLVWRAWSHYRALRGSQHIEFLIRNDLIKASPSKLLNDVYGFIEMERMQMGLQEIEALHEQTEVSNSKTSSNVQKVSEHYEKQTASTILNAVLEQQSYRDLEKTIANLRHRIDTATEMGEDRSFVTKLKEDFEKCKTYAHRVSTLADILERRIHDLPTEEPVTNADEELLLTSDDPKLIGITLDLPPLEIDLDRAREQVKKAILAKKNAEQNQDIRGKSA